MSRAESTPNVTSQQEDLEDVSNTFEVKLSVEVGSERSTVVVENVKTGETLLQVMEQASDQGSFTFKTKNTSLGPFVVSINGVEANPSLKQYWELIDANTGKPLTVGVGKYIPSQGDHILFRLSTY